MKGFFDSYYEFHTRVQILDCVLDSVELSPGNLNERDVVAVYKSAYPNGLISLGEGKSLLTIPLPSSKLAAESTFQGRSLADPTGPAPD